MCDIENGKFVIVGEFRVRENLKRGDMNQDPETEETNEEHQTENIQQIWITADRSLVFEALRISRTVCCQWCVQ